MRTGGVDPSVRSVQYLYSLWFLQKELLLFHCYVSFSTLTLPERSHQRLHITTASGGRLRVDIAARLLIQLHKTKFTRCKSENYSVKLEIFVKIIIRTQEPQHEARLHVHDSPPNTHTRYSPSLFGGYHRKVLNVRHFLPPDRQSAPCSQPLSSHFTRSTRWKPRELLYFPISPSASVLRRDPGL